MDKAKAAEPVRVNRLRTGYQHEQSTDCEPQRHLQAHGKSEHISTMKANTKGIVLRSELSFLNKI